MTRRDYVLGEVEHLLSFRVWPPTIADTLGYKDTGCLQRSLYRWGREDLASKFNDFDPLARPDFRGMSNAQRKAAA